MWGQKGKSQGAETTEVDGIPREVWRKDAGITVEEMVASLLRMQPGEVASSAEDSFQEASHRALSRALKTAERPAESQQA